MSAPRMRPRRVSSLGFKGLTPATYYIWLGARQREVNGPTKAPRGGSRLASALGPRSAERQISYQRHAQYAAWTGFPVHAARNPPPRCLPPTAPPAEVQAA